MSSDDRVKRPCLTHQSIDHTTLLYHLCCLLLLTCGTYPCRAELQQTGEELMSAFSLANSALEYIPPADVNGITVKSAAAKTKGVLYMMHMYMM